MYQTKNMILIPFNKQIAEKGNYYYWWYDQDVTKHNSHGLFPKHQSAFDEFFESIGKNNIVLAMLLQVEDEKGKRGIHIGNVSLQSINWINRSAEFAIIIGEKRCWGNGFAVEAGDMILRHGFEKMNLNRIWTGTAATNLGMQKVAERLGMIQEGTFREAMFLNNTYVDIFTYGITRRDYECRKFVN